MIIKNLYKYFHHRNKKIKILQNISTKMDSKINENHLN